MYTTVGAVNNLPHGLAVRSLGPMGYFVRVTNPDPEAGNAIMPHQPNPQPHSSVIDPDNIPETFATGPLNIEVTGPVALLTFTHARNDICDLMAGKQPPAMSVVVRARIVMPTEALGALRDVINQIIGASAPSSITTH
jgi:hypothetical protein